MTYRIAFSPRAGRRPLTLSGAMPREAAARQRLCADIDGFGLHASVRIEAHDHKRLERLCRSITRPALSDERIQVNSAGQVALRLETPWRDGTTHPGLGAAARARIRHRPAALNELRRRGAVDHRGDPAACGDREDPHPPGVGPPAAVPGDGRARRGTRATRSLPAEKRAIRGARHGLAHQRCSRDGAARQAAEAASRAVMPRE
jgi:hypothetical protein